MVGHVGLCEVAVGADYPAIPWGVALDSEQAVEHGRVDRSGLDGGVVDGVDDMG